MLSSTKPIIAPPSPATHTVGTSRRAAAAPTAVAIPSPIEPNAPGTGKTARIDRQVLPRREREPSDVGDDLRRRRQQLGEPDHRIAHVDGAATGDAAVPLLLDVAHRFGELRDTTPGRCRCVGLRQTFAQSAHHTRGVTRYRKIHRSEPP
ncbi:MAG: hypothetical protein WAW17_02080, partial [Rhodococcus sp. (in: high G+C Gram-positive bacteria)]|uniref:hypothetical protein n=1 Tax=Rhodococcus sp. TaxID=1831 RepID=UPI003BAF0720